MREQLFATNKIHQLKCLSHFNNINVYYLYYYLSEVINYWRVFLLNFQNFEINSNGFYYAELHSL